MPTLVPLREYVEAGFLLAYGPSYADHCQWAAINVDQILEGVPVQLPTTLQESLI